MGEPRRRWKIAAAAGLAGCVPFVAVLVRMQPYLPPAWRSFAQAVNSATPNGRILVRDYESREQQPAFQTFRAFIDYDKLVPCEWTGVCGDSITFESIKFLYILAREDLTDWGIQMQLITKSPPDFGWSVWEIEPGFLNSLRNGRIRGHENYRMGDPISEPSSQASRR